MVAIQTMLSLAMAMVATAAPSLQSRGSINTNLVFFRIDDSSCDPGTQLSPTVSVFNPPLSAGQTYTTNTCYPYQAWGSVHVENLQAGCTFEEFSDSACATPPVNSTSTPGSCVKGLGLDAFFLVQC
ncbi:hypothetical protein N431DRAFT_406261 [Stipitochalara longipes BDJ]|nr:hypothetical protein N431DRAFT_406261 [Stipitochalara longipes BDJ]